MIRIVLQATDAVRVCNQQQEGHVLTLWKDMAFVVSSENVGDVKINVRLSTQWKGQEEVSSQLQASAA